MDEKGIEGTIEYEFDSRGRIVRYKYSYLETDSRGNWTKRRVKRTWKSTTYGYENEPDKVSTKTEPEFTETRTIFPLS